jgi:CubicO group peptidase (beta-lactamase class C family)
MVDDWPRATPSQMGMGGGLLDELGPQFEAWRDQRLLSQHWIDESTAAHMNGEGLFFYGYQWWLGRSLVKRQEIRWVAAVGWGGQRMFIVPSLDLVVVVTAGLYGNPMMQSIPGEVVLRRYALAACV